MSGDEWIVKQVTGSAASRSYRCPGCDHEIRPATPHVVAWPTSTAWTGSNDEAALELRRHWHTACWRSRGNRAPRTPRSRNAPRH